MKLLFVDDEPIILKGLVRLLNYASLGYETVLEATSANQAMSLIGSECPDVIVSDIVMPDMTGLALLSHLREARLDTKVVFLSGYPNFEYAREAVSLGASDYLLKPVEKKKLESLLKEIHRELLFEREKDALHEQFQRIAEGAPEPSALEKWPEHNELQASHYCVSLLAIADNPNRTALENNLLRFSACNKAESSAESHGAFAFMKDDHLVMVACAKSSEAAEQSADALLEEVKKRLETELLIQALCVRGESIESTQGIPAEHQRLSILLEARNVTVPREENAIAKVKTYILAHYGQSLTLEVMASVACMSPGYFSSYFRKQTGMGFKDYLTRVRIEAAQRLLSESDLKVYEVAERVGFTDARHFSETFRRLTGKPPQQFR